MRTILAMAILAAVLLAFGARDSGRGAEASAVGTTAVPVLSCPDFSGDGTVDLLNDIFGVAFKFGTSSGSSEYLLLYDAGLADGTIDLLNDIFGVALRFGEECPLVDMQIAQATQAILTHPQADQILACDDATLNSLGYVRGSADVPGQGFHYFNAAYWDGQFNVTQPEGLVCQNGKLAAELYVVNGWAVGWGPFTPGSGPIHSVNIDSFCTNAPCSWDGPETWHAHSNLCLLHLGTPSATVTITPDSASCETANGGVGNWSWAQAVGWMGHLWNFIPNENLVPDTGGSNGRFADCRPPFKAETCPM